MYVRCGALLMPSVFYFFYPVGRNPFLFLLDFLLLFALSPRSAVLSGSESVSPHNSILSYWDLGAPLAAGRDEGVRTLEA